MNDTLKKMAFGLGGAFLLVATSLTAAESSCAEPCDPCCNPCGGKWSFGIEWLYWRPCADSVYAAVSGTEREDCSSACGSIDICEFKNHGFDYDFETGFRLALGYSNPSCYCWDAALVWTHFAPESDRTVKSPKPLSSGFLFPFYSEPVVCECSLSPCSDFDEVKASWELDLNLVDLDFSFAYCLNDCFRLNPFFGLRYATVDQDLHSRATYEESVELANILRQHYHHNFRGIGPRGGFGATWDLGCGFGLYGDLGLNIAFGQIDSGSRVKYEVVNNQTVSDGFKVKGEDDGRCSRFISDLAFGVTYKTACGCVDTTFRAGWEHHYFFNQGVADGAAGSLHLVKHKASDLSTQGLTLGLKVAY